jgi:RNA polymerase sigma-70 factor (ECF subfamily)
MAEPSTPAPEARPGGTSTAFDLVVVPEIPVLWRAAVAITGDPHEAEDLLQDTLLRAYRFVDGFDGRHPRAWLLTILRNTNLNRHRRRRPSLTATGDLPEAGAGAPAADSAEDQAVLTSTRGSKRRCSTSHPSSPRS